MAGVSVKQVGSMSRKANPAHDANWWRQECNYIDGVAAKGGKVAAMNNSTATFRRYCEMQRNSAEREGFYDAATYIQEVIDDLPATRKRNPLTRVKVKSPPQRPAGSTAAPSKRLVKRRKATQRAPEGYYANPVDLYELRDASSYANRVTETMVRSRAKSLAALVGATGQIDVEKAYGGFRLVQDSVNGGSRDLSERMNMREMLAFLDGAIMVAKAVK